MEIIKVELKNNRALKLLEDLEELDIIKLHKVSEKKDGKDKASKYRGPLSPDTADALLKYTEESRNEWETRFPTE